MNNFGTRTISGFLLVGIIVGAISLGGLFFAITFALISGLALLEFHKLTNLSNQIHVNKTLSFVGGLLLFGCSYLFSSALAPLQVYSIYGLYVLLVFLTELFRKNANPINNWAYFILGQVLIALPFSTLPTILFADNHQAEPILLLSLFFTIWVNDTGAYLVGISVGKHRMFERVSPKKSWEGFFGGAVLALVSGYVFSLFIPSISLFHWFVFSEIIVVFGTFGDLLESLLKRTLAVKDSGDVIPGHGGFLDRFDSMLLAAPAALIYLLLIFN